MLKANAPKSPKDPHIADVTLRLEEQERQAREERIRDLLPNENEALGKAYDGRLVRRLLTYLAPYKVKLWMAIFLMVVSSLLSVFGPAIIGRAIDDGLRTNSFATFRFWTLIFIVTATGEWLTNRTRILLMALVGTKVVADIRSHLFRHLHTLSFNFYNNYSVGRLMSRLISDVEVMQEFITWSITGLFRSIFTLIGIVLAMFLSNWRLTLVAFLVVPLMVYLSGYWQKHVREAYRATRQRLSLINGYLNESITGIRVTKSFTREKMNFGHFDVSSQ